MDWRLQVGKQVESMHWRLKESFAMQHDAQLSINKLLKHLEISSLTNGPEPRCESSPAQLLVDVHVQAQAHVQPETYINESEVHS